MLSYFSSLLSEPKPSMVASQDPFASLKYRNVDGGQILHVQQHEMNPFTEETYSSNYRIILEKRKDLPVYQKLNEFLNLYQMGGPVMLLTGETGSGKSTQIPQFVVYSDLPHLQNKMVACTQPRRIAATSIAERVAKEMDVELGQEVGYSVRFEELVAPGKTFLKYMTDGMLLREAMHDRDLTKYSTIILDESQERSFNTDILMGLLKDIIKRRPDLKVIIMSAVDNPKFRSFFSIGPQNFLSVTGRTYPVDINYAHFQDDKFNNVVIKTVLDIHCTEGPGDILVFLTGAKEIEDACRTLRDEGTRLSESQCLGPLVCIPLYASLSAVDQEKVFEILPASNPPGRKVVIATNIAETSLTIDGVVYVVDCGYEKSVMYDPMTGFETLQKRFISQASAQQRSGRAGRTQPGKCYRLYTERQYKSLDMHTYPQILRCNLSSIVLILLKLGVKDVLSFKFIDRPSHASVRRALDLLRSLDAIDQNDELTEEGAVMADFPMIPQLSKALMTSPAFGCSKDMVTIAAMLCAKSVWLRPSHRQREADLAKKAFIVPGGDHLTLLNVYHCYDQNREDKEWPYEHYLSSHSLEEAEEVRVQLKSLMSENNLPLVSDPKDKDENIRKALLSGFFMQVAQRTESGNSYLTLIGQQEVLLHPSCAFLPKNRKPQWVLYNKYSFTTRAFLHDVSVIQPEWLPKGF